MGFSLSLLIAHPWVSAQKEEPSWYVHEVVALGRVTRLEKLVSERYRHIRFDSTTKAGICVASSIFRHLVAMLQSPQRSHFVPQFAPMVGGFSSFESGGVHPLRLWLSETCLPPIELMQNHNKLVGGEDCKLFHYAKEEFNAVLDPLLMWEECSIVANWLKILLRSSTTQSGRVLREDNVARTYVRAWQRYLEEMGKLDTKVIFLFADAKSLL